MIAHLTGTVAGIRLDSAVLDVNGVGYLVHATPGTLGTLRHGATVTLFTSLVVREDAMTVFGFADDDERAVFETVQSVSGVGPRLALAMLAVHSPEALRAAVAGEDLKALERVPGIGRKSAQRIVLELSGKLGAPVGTGAAAAAGATAGSADARRDEVVAALVGLGWTQKVAEDAVDTVSEGGATSDPDAGAAGTPSEQVASTLRAALRLLGGRRG
ncbi:Holliday junction branch migration protein RuvA [Luteimicrobium sp. NPDC057192]|uniref:Holliday junction branch migration protein RuvA n=1 Tax=Luteimicrobium sp. NPDC057192 TaxID=3346042 RepID=UPI003640595B